MADASCPHAGTHIDDGYEAQRCDDCGAVIVLMRVQESGSTRRSRVVGVARPPDEGPGAGGKGGIRPGNTGEDAGVSPPGGGPPLPSPPSQPGPGPGSPPVGGADLLDAAKAVVRWNEGLKADTFLGILEREAERGTSKVRQYERDIKRLMAAIAVEEKQQEWETRPLGGDRRTGSTAPPNDSRSGRDAGEGGGSELGSRRQDAPETTQDASGLNAPPPETPVLTTDASDGGPDGYQGREGTDAKEGGDRPAGTPPSAKAGPDPPGLAWAADAYSCPPCPSCGNWCGCAHPAPPDTCLHPEDHRKNNHHHGAFGDAVGRAGVCLHVWGWTGPVPRMWWWRAEACRLSWDLELLGGDGRRERERAEKAEADLAEEQRQHDRDHAIKRQAMTRFEEEQKRAEAAEARCLWLTDAGEANDRRATEAENRAERFRAVLRRIALWTCTGESDGDCGHCPGCQARAALRDPPPGGAEKEERR